ncbi:MAG TPA: TVP38/TMEM64 family protein [Candidatus Tectomicrobia bacterium]|jgi:uncharacterized membrane protein YdjX (TVP38/TMEM64 family)
MTTIKKQSGARHFSYGRLVPVLVLVVGLVVFFALGLERYLSFDTLREHRTTLRAWVETSEVRAALLFMAIYAMVVAFSVPGATVLSITGGFLFGTVWGAVCNVISATLGATVLFLIAKTAFGDTLRTRAGPWLQNMEAGFRDNALSYLLVLRLVPLFPFFMVNLVPALLGVPLSTYVLGTFVGIIPGALVYATVGAGLGSIFDAGGEFSASGILTPQVLLSLLGLAVLAMLPVVYKKLKARAH